MSNIGKTIKITGDIAGSEDLIVEGKIEGEVQLPGNRIVLSEAGSIHGDLHVASVEVRGRFNGRIVASETVTLGSTAKAEGSILSPSIEMADGAGFRGAVETRSGKS
jgi:cytoskeletal protein CcmA (bactofilin family)